MSIATDIGLALRLARRELRGGARGFAVFLACLALGAATIAAVGSFSASVDAGLRTDARRLLGGDLQIIRSQLAPPPDVAELLAARGRVSHIVRMRTMARSDSGAATLAELKAVDASYPLYGSVELASGKPLATALALKGGIHGAVVEQELLARLGINLGDVINVGEGHLRVTDVILREPDRVSQFFGLGPRIMISTSGLAASGLLRPDTLARHVLNLRLPGVATLEQVSALESELEAAHPGADWRIHRFNQSARGLRRFTDTMDMYLTLVGLSALLVGGVGVAGAVRGFLAGRLRTIAVMKALGASRRMTTSVYLTQVLALALAGCVTGAVGGAAAAAAVAEPLAERLGVPIGNGLHLEPMVEAVAYGLLTALAFSLWPLSSAGRIGPARLFRGYADAAPQRPTPAAIGATALATLAFFALLWLTADARAVTFGFAAAAVICAGVLFVYARIVRRTASRIPSPAQPHLRQALANIHRPGASTGSVIFSLGLGLTVLTSVALVDGNIQDIAGRRTPGQAPSYFLVDIPRADMAELAQAALDIPGVSRLEREPSVRGRITHINGRPARPEDVDPSVAWALNSDRSLTFAHAQPDKITLASGTWWDGDYAGPPVICLDHDIAKGFGMRLGDTLTVNILGRPITASVVCTRHIDWTTAAVNHAIIFGPGVLENAPYTFIATAYAEPGAEASLFAMLTKRFPHVVVISMRRVLADVQGIIDNIGLAVRATAAVTLLAGLLVLSEALRANLRSRHRDAVIFKVLGATPRDIMLALTLEFALLGAAAALLATALGVAGAWTFVHFVLETQWILPVGPMLAIPAGGVAATVMLGLLGVRRTLAQSAWTVLRNE
ncbi:putative ABC transport system permease protein [Desulfobaculum xiamenense]|uniref:Putative ABC transport system permease protein n=1 Tax=Desulfobaculum xiamenense TaxID=995050 RepID=A0A846QI78_9BACT|nr:FtsX-like permease family protein [Desulfobaculum xiamenense]NJB67891.1 putative ABC transport system permease protein [Desulfobaculum xiamenense]